MKSINFSAVTSGVLSFTKTILTPDPVFVETPITTSHFTMPEDNETYDIGDSYCEHETSEMDLLLQANEQKILNASMKAIKSGTLTPLVKEELRYTIQSRRLAAGKGELKLEEFKKPPKRKPVSEFIETPIENELLTELMDGWLDGWIGGFGWMDECLDGFR